MLVFVRKATRTRILILLCFVLVLLGARAGMELSRSSSIATGARASPITRIPTSRTEVALAIDLVSADAETVRELAAVLSRGEAKVTWFVSATWAETNAGIISTLAQEGHELGVKGTDDRRVDRLSPSELKLRLVRARQAVANAGIEPAPFFYPPEGKLAEAGVVAALEEGFHTVLGSADLRKLGGKPEDVARKLNLVPGDIAFVEVSGKKLRPPLSSIEAVVSWAKLHGLTLVRISDLVRGVR